MALISVNIIADIHEENETAYLNRVTDLVKDVQAEGDHIYDATLVQIAGDGVRIDLQEL